MGPPLLYTVGHSNRSLDEFLALLAGAGVAVLVDVRAVPVSARHPQFSEKTLRAALEDAGLSYHWAGRQLGGRRQSRPHTAHSALAGTPLQGYADYMDSEPFQRAAVQLMRLATRAPTAVLCAERLPEHCHRGLLADYLTLQGVCVRHLIGVGEVREHALDPRARRESGRLVYDRNTSGELDLG